MSDDKLSSSSESEDIKKNEESYEKNLEHQKKRENIELSEINTTNEIKNSNLNSVNRNKGFGENNDKTIEKEFDSEINIKNKENERNSSFNDSHQRKGTGRPRGMINSGFGNNDNMRNTGFGSNRNTGFGNNDNMRSTGFGNNDNMRSTGFGNNDNMRSTGFGNNDNMRSTGFGNNNRNFGFRNNNNYNDRFGGRGQRRYNNRDNIDFNYRGRRGGRFPNRNNYRNNMNQNFNYDNFHIDDGTNYYNSGNNNNEKKENEINPRLKNILAEYKDIVFQIEKTYSELTENEIGNILLEISEKTSQTIFESMNDISSYSLIKKTENHYKKKLHLKPFLDNFELNIFEEINLKYLNQTHKEILLYYKVYSIEEKQKLNILNNLPDSFFYEKEEERRRKLLKNEDGIYNYIPIKCTKQHRDEKEKEKCYYSHTYNEIYFHSLIYKTKKCTKKDCPNNSNIELCFNSHNFDNDFRLIYNYIDKNLIELMCIFEKKFKKKIKPYDECYNFDNILESDFNLDTFKVLECNNEFDQCEKDYHLCYFYHDKSEKRRPPKLFRYCGDICEKVLMNGKYYPENCPYQNYCHFCHSKYEFYYHSENFRKIVICVRNRNENGECEFIETCYGIHNNDEYNRLSKKKKKIDLKEIELKNLIKKYDVLKKTIQHFSCLNCKKLPKDKVFYADKVIHDKKIHFLCKKCKESCENKCPICQKEMLEDNIIEITIKE